MTTVGPALSIPKQTLFSPRGWSPGSIWRAPLVPVALSLTAGIVLDRSFSVPIAGSLLAATAFLATWGTLTWAPLRGLNLVYLWASVGALGAAYHHWHCQPNDALRALASEEPRPVRLRGVVDSEPAFLAAKTNEPLRAFPGIDTTRFVLRTTHLYTPDGWQPTTGRTQVTVQGRADTGHPGDLIEVVGQLSLPPAPANPGEFDYAAYLRDQGIGTALVVRKTAEGLVRLQERWPGSLDGWLAILRGWGKQVVERSLPPEQAGLTTALLLGEGSAMTSDGWERYQRTGVIHALAVSGQHLAVLAWLLWIFLRVAGISPRRGAVAVGVFLLLYAWLAGARPPVMRAAWALLALGGAVLFRRLPMPVNSFALAWILVAAMDPTDISNGGCQLSFLAVGVLYWGASGFSQRFPLRNLWRGLCGRPLLADDDPFEQLRWEALPRWRRCCGHCARLLVVAYLVNTAVWLAVTPVIMARYNMISPIALLIGPPVVLFSSLALLSGFLMLLLAPILAPISTVFAWFTSVSLSACEFFVDRALTVPGGCAYVPDVPAWWMVVFYGGLLPALALPWLRRRWNRLVLAGAGWYVVLFLLPLWPRSGTEFRCTFLAVGHGGCTVLELPSGEVLLYDAGAITGPDVTRRQIAPFLWHRGIRRIKQIFVSHADLDHFNGLPALLERFRIDKITTTPTFAERPTAAAKATMEAIYRAGVRMDIVRAGDRFTVGDVDFEVLHPPAAGPAGNENARSLTMVVRCRGHSILLTGDLEGPGLQRVLALPPVKVDVLMAPHHGSVKANPRELADWARPHIVISSQGRPRGSKLPHYDPRNYLTTWPHGAVTVRSNAQELVVETYRSKQRSVLPQNRD